MKRSEGKKRVRLLVILLLVTVAAVVAAIIELTTVVRSEMSESLMKRTVDQAEMAFRDQLDKLFSPLQGHLAVVERWDERGLLRLDDHRALNDLFIPMLEQFPWVTSMMIATEYGAEYMLLREDSTWVSRATDAGADPGRVRWRRWSPDDSLVADWREDLVYDPRNRPWYLAAFDDKAVDERGISWTEPYMFFTTKQLGVTLSKSWRTTGSGAVTHVAGIDVPLDAVIRFTGDLVNARDGFSFLINRDHHVLDMRGAADARSTRTPTQKEIDFMNAWRSNGATVEMPLLVRSEGGQWWVEFRAVSSDSARLWLAVAVPKSSFTGEVRTRQHQSVLVILGILLIGVFVTILATHARRDTGGGGLDLADEAALLELITGGEGDRLEFKSTLRWNINADKPGKEVEISWLKTVVAYLNTDGGVLLIGVNDDGEVIGLESDNFANDDKFMLHYNNLFKDHVGMEFATQVSSRIVAIAEQKVFVIQCEPASDPVYLRHGKEEKYYVRMGPSSRALTTSQVVDHVSKRK
jgi:hypothetical protein